MAQELRYGQQGKVHFDLPPEALIADFTSPSMAPLDDIVAAVAAALSSPLQFPPIAQATVPGDHIVVALDQAVPQAEDVIAGVVHSLLEGEIDPGNITLVRVASDAGRTAGDPLALLAPELRAQIDVLTHDPADPATLTYLAASRAARPIYLNRALLDADVVVPIGCLRLEESLNWLGINAGLYPAFSDEKTQRRFRAPRHISWQAHRQRRRREASEAAWLLGAQFTVQVVPGPGESLLHVLAGDPTAVSQRGRRLCEAAWRHEVPRSASLVVASIEGGPEQQTWSNFARALYAASRVVSYEGTIVLCTQLHCQPGAALQRLIEADEDPELPRQLQRDRTADALSAWLLFETRRHAHVYLLSGLESETVEELGMGYIEKPEEITRLSRQHESCILLPSAQYAMPFPRQEQEERTWLMLH